MYDKNITVVDLQNQMFSEAEQLVLKILKIGPTDLC